MQYQYRRSYLECLECFSITSVSFRSAIWKYANESTFAWVAEKEKRITNGELGELWIDAASILETRFVLSPEDLERFVKNFGACFALDVFWNHATAVFDELINGSSLELTDRENPIFRLMTKHAGKCLTCDRHFEIELGAFETMNWKREYETPYTVAMTLLREQRNVQHEDQSR